MNETCTALRAALDDLGELNRKLDATNDWIKDRISAGTADQYSTEAAECVDAALKLLEQAYQHIEEASTFVYDPMDCDEYDDESNDDYF